MKQKIFNVLVAFSVIALFILVFNVSPKSEKPAVMEVEPSGELLPIAIINTDSILQHYTLAIEATDHLMSKYEESTLKLDSKAKALQKEYSSRMC